MTIIVTITIAIEVGMTNIITKEYESVDLLVYSK